MRRQYFRDLTSKGLCGLSLLAACAISGQELPVNDHTAGGQGAPATAGAAGGDFVAVWLSDDSPGTDPDLSVQARRFGSDGAPIGGQFQVNTTTTGEQTAASVAMAPDGRFVVAWQSASSPGDDASDTAILARRFDSAGAAVGTDFQVNVSTTGEQAYPSVAMQSDGDFLVVWDDLDSGADRDVLGRFFAADGTAIGGELAASSEALGDQLTPAVARTPDDRFLVVYATVDGPDSAIAGQWLDEDGMLLGAELAVNTSPSGVRSYPHAGISPEGDIAVVWTEFSGSLGALSATVAGRRFEADGTPKGGEIPLPVETAGDQALARVGVDQQGSFFATWASLDFDSDSGDGVDGSGASVQGRRFTGDGLGHDEMTVNLHTQDHQFEPALWVREDGSAVVTWTSLDSPDDPSESGIRLRIVSSPYLFSDGFESGDTKSWSATVSP